MDLLKTVFIWKAQGFKTPEELFLVGYIMAHGGELYFLRQVAEDLKLLARNPDFWSKIVEDAHGIRIKVALEDLEKAKETLRNLLRKRNAKIPKWLEQSEASI